MVATKIENCTVEDAAALARNNMTGYWTDSTWRLNFKGRTIEDVIVQCTKRVPIMLLTSRTTKRHQKVVDTQTGEVIGYARWIMPFQLTDEWLEAQTPQVSRIDEEKYMNEFRSANWIRQTDKNSLGQPLGDIMDRLMHGNDFLGT